MEVVSSLAVLCFISRATSREGRPPAASRAQEPSQELAFFGGQVSSHIHMVRNARHNSTQLYSTCQRHCPTATRTDRGTRSAAWTPTSSCLTRPRRRTGGASRAVPSHCPHRCCCQLACARARRFLSARPCPDHTSRRASRDRPGSAPGPRGGAREQTRSFQ